MSRTGNISSLTRYSALNYYYRTLAFRTADHRGNRIGLCGLLKPPSLLSQISGLVQCSFAIVNPVNPHYEPPTPVFISLSKYLANLPTDGLFPEIEVAWLPKKLNCQLPHPHNDEITQFIPLICEPRIIDIDMPRYKSTSQYYLRHPPLSVFLLSDTSPAASPVPSPITLSETS